MTNKINEEELQSLCDYSKKVIESKGWSFHKSSFKQGFKEAERFYNIGTEDSEPVKEVMETILGVKRKS
jgi:hypothetical protein